MLDHDSLLTDPDERRRFHAAYRVLADGVRASLGLYTSLVDEFAARARADGRDIHAVPLLLAFEFADAIDGVALLAERGAARNCQPLLRSAFEVQLGLRYMMDNKDDYPRRVLAYEFSHKRSRLRWLEKCDPTTDVGRQLHAELNGDLVPDLFADAGRHIGVAAEVQKARDGLLTPRYAEARTEYERMKAAHPQRKPPKHWYSLWGGPDNARALARRLHLLSGYESVYCQWSATLHGEAVVQRASGMTADGLANFQPYRSPEGLASACHMAAVLCNSMAVFLARSVAGAVDDPVIAATLERLRREVQPHTRMLLKAVQENVVPVPRCSPTARPPDVQPTG